MSSRQPKRNLMLATIAILALAIVLILVLPLKLPLPLRLAVAGTDLIAGLVVFVAWRQQGRV